MKLEIKRNNRPTLKQLNTGDFFVADDAHMHAYDGGVFAVIGEEDNEGNTVDVIQFSSEFGPMKCALPNRTIVRPIPRDNVKLVVEIPET